MSRDRHARQTSLSGAFAAGTEGGPAVIAMTLNPDPAVRLRDRVTA